MAEATLGTVTAKVTTDNSQFDAAMQKSSEIVGATARENAKAAKMQADFLTFSAKYSADAVTAQSLRIVTALKMQTAAEAEYRQARKYAKDLDEQAGTELLAKNYQRLTAARLEAAEAARVENAATEATVLTQRQAVSAVVRASEGQQGIRAVEGFLTMIPGVGAALQNIFPLIGGAMFLAMLAKMGTELYDLAEKGKHSAEELTRDFGQFNDKLETSNDELALTDSKLKDEIGRLSGHPGNGLETALLEAKVAADKLEESLAADLKGLQELLKQHDVSQMEGMLAGVRPTGAASAAIDKRSNAAHDAVQEARYALDAELVNVNTAHRSALAEAAGNHERIKAAEDAFHAAQLQAQRRYNDAAKQATLDFAKWNEEQASKVPAPSKGKGTVLSMVAGAVGGPAAGAAVSAYERGQQGDPTQIRKQYEKAARTARDLANRVDLTSDVFNDTAGVEALKQKKALTGEEDKAAEQRLRAMELELDEEKRQFGMSLKTELAYWDARISAFAKGSAEYKTIMDKETALAVEGAKQSASAIKRFKDQQIREQVQGDRELQQAMAEGTRAMRGMDKERYEAQEVQRKDVDNVFLERKAGEDRIREFQLSMGTAGDSARGVADIHNAAAQREMDSLKDDKANAMLNPDVQRREQEVAAIDKQIERLRQSTELMALEDEKRIESTTLLGGANDALREFIRESTDAGAAMKKWLGSSLNTTNDAIVRAMSGEKANFGEAGHEIFKNASAALLKGAEGSFMKMLTGKDGKKHDGSSESAALYVQLAGAGKLPHIPGMDKWGGNDSSEKGSGGLLGSLAKIFHHGSSDDGSGDGGDSSGDSAAGMLSTLGKLFGLGGGKKGGSDAGGTLFGGPNELGDGSDSGGGMTDTLLSGLSGLTGGMFGKGKGDGSSPSSPLYVKNVGGSAGGSMGGFGGLGSMLGDGSGDDSSGDGGGGLLSSVMSMFGGGAGGDSGGDSGGGGGFLSLLASGLPGFADGTDFAPGGPSWVGERGPEIVNLPRGSSVTPNHKAFGGPSYHHHGDINIDAGSGVDKEELKGYMLRAVDQRMQTHLRGVGAGMTDARSRVPSSRRGF